MSFADFFGGGNVTGAATAVVDETIEARVGEVKIIQIPCNQDITGATLTFLVETRRKVDVATVADGSIGKSSTTATLTLTSAMTSAERTLRWNLYKSDTGESVASGLFICEYKPQGDA